MNDEIKTEYTKEELAAISARMKALITEDDISGFDGPTKPIEEVFAELDKQFPGHFQWDVESIRG
jgi:hypothetical protein